MGLDFLDFTLRVEKQFNIKIARGDSLRLPQRRPSDITAGELHDWLVAILRQRGVAVPFSSWNRVRLILADIVGKPPQIIRRATFIVKELGFS